MRRTFTCAVIVCFHGWAFLAIAADTPQKIAGPFKNPESVCYGDDGDLFVTEIGEPGKDGDGKVTRLKDGALQTFAVGLDDPKGMVYYKNALYVTDKTKVVKIDSEGNATVAWGADAFPTTPLFLNDIAVEPTLGTFLVSDSGERNGKGGAVFRIESKTDKIVAIADASSGLHTPNGVIFDGETHALIADFGSGKLFRVKFEDNSIEQLADGMDGADGLVWDHFGRLFITSWKTGKTFTIPRPGMSPILIGEGLQSAADCCLSQSGRDLLIPDMKAGTLTSLSTKIPRWEVDESELNVGVEVAFPNLKWTDWDDGSESGRLTPLRPIVLTHPNDGAHRIFVATQQGVIHSFENDDQAKVTKVFLDLTGRVRYRDKQNEEGLLGFAFHPQFTTNGEFFVFYTDTRAEMANVLSRFRVKPNDHSIGDPDSEEELIRFEKPFWNHDGGSITFGADGFLYVSHGDGGAANDPHENGQNLKTLLGKVLRIDVDHKSSGKKYSIPADNPFVGRSDALPEIWAYGLRNVWRMAFDRQTGELWGAEVGQNLYEEIIFIKRGLNYGWNLREGLHPFGAKGVNVRTDLVEPIWEYDHELGKSITGGAVYRGKKIPELNGAYLYADYVSTRMWALRYDAKLGRVTANQLIPSAQLAVMSFGEDDVGELYALVVSPTGQGVYRLTRSSESKAASPR